MQQFFSNGNLLPSLHLLINTVSAFIDKLPVTLSIHMPYVSLPFILADVDVEAVKGEMPWQRSLSRYRNWEGKVITLTYFLRYTLWGHQSCLSLMRSQADMVLYQQDMRSQVVHGGLGHRRRMRIFQGGNRAVRG